MSTRVRRPATEAARLVTAIARALQARGERLALAESCTGGWVAKLCTDQAGSSRWFEGAAVVYSNAAKQRLLEVPPRVLAETGAVSAEAVLAMVDGTLRRFAVDWAVAISGIAGPDGGTPEKPVGTVWIAWGGMRIAASASRYAFAGNRRAVREAAALAALQGLADLLGTATS